MIGSVTGADSRFQFVQLLAAQVQNQDPIDPVKQETFIGQLSQFSMLEGIEKMNNSFESLLHNQELAQGMDLVGKRVQYLDSLSGNVVTGFAQQAFVADGQLHVIVSGKDVSLSQIMGVVAE
jgi:flagellar basal-body rod modification protein FlgD